MPKKSVLDVSVDITSDKIKKPVDVKVKINRPFIEKQKKKKTDKASKDLAAITDPKKLGVSHRDLNIAYTSTPKDFPDIDQNDIYNSIQTVDWGDYDVEKIVSWLVAIAEKISGNKFKAYQIPIAARVFRSILLNDGQKITVLISRQAGKSYTLSVTSVTLCVCMPALAKEFPAQLDVYKDGFYVCLFAPTKEQTVPIYRTAMKIAKATSAQVVYEDDDIRIKTGRSGCSWDNGSFIVNQGASRRSLPESKTAHLLLGDETQSFDDGIIEKSLLPMTSWTNGTSVFLGTTSDKPCYFYDLIQRNKSGDLVKSEENKNHFEFDYKVVQKYNPRYRASVRSAIADLGIESKEFQMNYCLKWFFDQGLAVSDEDLKKYCMYTSIGMTRYTDKPTVVGIDLASKHKSTVVTVGELKKIELDYADGPIQIVDAVQVCDWYEIEKINYPQQRPLIKAFLERFTNIKIIVIDTTGVGDVFYQEVASEWAILCRSIEPFVFSPKAKNYLMNLFYEYFFSRRLLIPNTKSVRSLPVWQKFYLQMVNLEKHTKAGVTFLGKNARESSRDDFPDSLFLMLHGAKLYTKKNSEIEFIPTDNLFRRGSKQEAPRRMGRRRPVIKTKSIFRK